MNNNNNRDYSKENYLRNGIKTQDKHAKSSLNTTVEQPGINKSGLNAKKKGF